MLRCMVGLTYSFIVVFLFLSRYRRNNVFRHVFGKIFLLCSFIGRSIFSFILGM